MDVGRVRQKWIKTKVPSSIVGYVCHVFNLWLPEIIASIILKLVYLINLFWVNYVEREDTFNSCKPVVKNMG